MGCGNQHIPVLLTTHCFLWPAQPSLGCRQCPDDGRPCSAVGTVAPGAPHCYARQHGIKHRPGAPRSPPQDEGVVRSGGATCCAPACSLSAYSTTTTPTTPSFLLLFTHRSCQAKFSPASDCTSSTKTLGVIRCPEMCFYMGFQLPAMIGTRFGKV